jgi:hypothetical protein
MGSALWDVECHSICSPLCVERLPLSSGHPVKVSVLLFRFGFVTRTDLPFFEGVGYQKGDVIGDVVGYEWDNTDPDGDGRRLWNPDQSQIPPIDPASIKVVFTGSPVDLDGKQGKAEAVYFVSSAGANVFSTGSIRWAWGLSKPGFEQGKF